MTPRSLLPLALLLPCLAVSQTPLWYERLPQPEEVSKARTVKELLPYLGDRVEYPLPMLALLRIAELGGEEAVDALYNTYETADSSCGIDGPNLPKVMAVRLLGRVGGERAAGMAVGILRRVMEFEEHPGLGPLRTHLAIAVTDALGSMWKNDLALASLEQLWDTPTKTMRATDVDRIKAALLRIEMNRKGIAGTDEEVGYLLGVVKGPGYCEETKVAPGQFTREAYVTEAVNDLLRFHYGSQVLPQVELYLAERGDTLNRGAKEAIERIVKGLRLVGEAERRDTERLDRMREALSRPGTRLVVKEDARGKWMEAVPVDTSAVEPDRRGEDEGWRQFLLDIASRPHSTSRDRAWAYRALALTAAKAGQWDQALEYYERMEKEDYEHAFTTEVDIAKEKEALRQRRYPGP